MRARHVLLLLSLCCLWGCAPAKSPCQPPYAASDQPPVAQSSDAQPADAQSPDAQPADASVADAMAEQRAAVEASWGIRPLGWYVFDHGRRSELRYQVVDAARAQAALDRLVWPTLLREDDGEAYSLINPLKPGNLLLLRDGKAKAGQLFYLRLSHQPFQLFPGQHVTLILAADTRRLGSQTLSASGPQAASSDQYQDQELRLPCMTVEELP